MRVLAGRYELVRFVGRGGMGEVWEGRDRLIERRVAVKLLPHAKADASGAALFFREARTAGALHHPGVVTVYDLGQDEGDGSLFLVMEFVEGRDLAAVLDKEGPPSVGTAVGWAAQAAAALARAHTAGIVHRDLKPANLMLTVEDQVKILDFGIARFVESTNRSSKVMGTLAYMPPERFDEQPGDARSDLYSLGCVLHELLTGNVPFHAGGPVSMMNAHLRKTPTRPGEHRHGVPTELDDLVLALLAKDPRDRPDTADEVHRLLRAAVDLAPAAETRRMVRETNPIGDAPTIGLDREPAASGTPRSGNGGTPSKAPTPTRRRLLWLVGGGAVTALGISGVLELIDSPDDRREPRTAGDQVPSSPPAVARTDTTVRWSYSTGAEVDSSPAVVDGVVYIGSHDKNVYALDAATGTKKWAYTTGHVVGSSPAVVNGVVYVGSRDKNVYALDAATGTKKWGYATGAEVDSSPVVVDGVVYIGCRNKNVYALDAATGAKKWAYATGAEISSVPAAADGVVYVGSVDMNVYALDAATGTKKWAYATGAEVFSSPVVVDRVVYVGSADKNVYALDAATGTKKWAYATGDKVASSPVVVGGAVYVGSADKNVYALDAATGAKKWAYTTGGIVWQSPAVVGGVVYVPSNDKNVYALDAATGAKKWAYSIGASTSSVPVVAGGVVYIGSGDKNVYALDAVPGTGPSY
ncbi:PQQ-binding-like beta-propeller repeat protein [Embleya scabrispora]|uniref:serine/threonine-protein kinase n=1 Tax=Embleya scabrispora TaxID=159449 RepID=UPI000380B60C|nr:serine/threonine-protein kinase [Embleya scabrispora]